MDISIKTLMALLPALAATLAMAATPDENYTRLCTTCHLPGVHGAPRVGDRKNWTQRLHSGLNIVYRNAIEGVPNTAMLAKGGHTELSDIELRAIVDYMITATALPPSVLRDARRYDKLGLSDRDFIRRDVSRDGYLSLREITVDPLLLKNFSCFDINKDGRPARPNTGARKPCWNRNASPLRWMMQNLMLQYTKPSVQSKAWPRAM